MFGKKITLKSVNVACLRPEGLKQARKEGVGGEILAYVW